MKPQLISLKASLSKRTIPQPWLGNFHFGPQLLINYKRFLTYFIHTVLGVSFTMFSATSRETSSCRRVIRITLGAWEVGGMSLKSTHLVVRVHEQEVIKESLAPASRNTSRSFS